MGKLPFLPVALWGVVTFAYATRRFFQGSLDPYVVALVGIPVALLVLGRVSLDDLGIRKGKPFFGLAFMLLLPVALFLRLHFSGVLLAPHPDVGLVLASAAEELFFRGYLQDAFKSMGTYQSFAVVNVLFALVHFVKGYSLLPLAVIFAVGVYFSYVRDRQGSGSVVYPMGAHGLYNLVATARLA